MTPVCGTCQAPATCAFDDGTGLRHACRAHDPTQVPAGHTLTGLRFYRDLTITIPAAADWPPPAENR